MSSRICKELEATALPHTKKYFFSFTEVLSSNLLALLTPLSPCVCMYVIWRRALLEHPAMQWGHRD